MSAKRTLIGSVLICSSILATGSAARCSVDQDMQMWTPVVLDIPIHRKLRGYMEVGPRIGDGVSKVKQLLVRPALEYRFNKSFSFFTGYLWQTTYGDPQVLHENRIWQQILLDKDIKRLSILNRTRLEQRMFNDVSGTGHRARHMVKLDFDISKKFYLCNFHELFVNLNSVKDGPQRGIDQYRMFAGVGVRPLKNTRVEAGYQYQYVNRADQFDDQGNHAILIQTFIGLKD